jgi:hypothetical protein
MQSSLNFFYTVVPPLSVGDMFQDPQWIPETMDITKLYVSYLLYFFYTYVSIINKMYFAEMDLGFGIDLIGRSKH